MSEEPANLALGTQRGFAATSVGNPLTVQQEVDKLRLITEVAKQVWGGTTR